MLNRLKLLQLLSPNITSMYRTMYPFDIETWSTGMNLVEKPRHLKLDPRYVFERAFKAWTAVVSMKGMADASVHQNLWYMISAEMIWKIMVHEASRYPIWYLYIFETALIWDDIWWSNKKITKFLSWIHRFLEKYPVAKWLKVQCQWVLQYLAIPTPHVAKKVKPSLPWNISRLLAVGNYKAVHRNHQKILFFNPFLQTLNLSIHGWNLRTIDICTCTWFASDCHISLQVVLQIVVTIIMFILHWRGGQISSLQ